MRENSLRSLALGSLIRSLTSRDSERLTVDEMTALLSDNRESFREALDAPDDVSLPADFTYVGHALPKHSNFVLVVRLPAHRESTFEVLTARHQKDRHPSLAWHTGAGYAVTDSGGEVLGWREAPEWLS